MIHIHGVRTYPTFKVDKYSLTIINKNTFPYDLSSFYIKKKKSNKKIYKKLKVSL